MRRNWTWAQSLSFFHTGLGDKLARNNPEELQTHPLYGRYLWKFLSTTDFGSCEEDLSHFSLSPLSSQYADFEGVQLSWHHHTPWKSRHMPRPTSLPFLQFPYDDDIKKKNQKSPVSSPKLQTAPNWINIKKSNWHQKLPNRREMYVVTNRGFSEEEKITKLLLPLVLTHHVLAAGTDILKGVCGCGDVPNAFTCLAAQICCLELT